jgi:hypothetical protein
MDNAAFVPTGFKRSSKREKVRKNQHKSADLRKFQKGFRGAENCRRSGNTQQELIPDAKYLTLSATTL